MTEEERIATSEDIKDELDGKRIEKEDIIDKTLLINLENMIEIEDDKRPYGIIQFSIPPKKEFYTTTIGGVAFKKLLSLKQGFYLKAKLSLIKQDRKNPVKGEENWFWNFK